MGVILGQFSDDLAERDKLEQLLGHVMAGWRQNAAFEVTDKRLGANFEREIVRGSHWCYRNANTEPTLWKDVIAGSIDEAIDLSGHAILDSPLVTAGNRLKFSIHHEQHVDNEIQPNMGTPAEYAPMFKHVRARMLATGCGDKVRFVFCPSVSQYIVPDDWHVNNMAPDPSIYAFSACDFYSKITPKNQLKRSWRDLEPVAAFAKRVGKRWGIGEFGIEEHPDKPRVMDEIFAWIKSLGTTGPGTCGWIYLTNKTTIDGDMRPHSSPAAAAVIKKWAADPFYRAGLPA